MQAGSRRRWGSIIYLAGALLGLGLAVIASWGDYEAMAYFEQGAGYERFSGLNCPILASVSETSTLSATFDNNSTQAIQPYYEVDISATASTRHMEDQITVPAHSSRTVSWTVDANDLNLGGFILVRLDVLPVAGHSTREATCGLVVMNLGRLSGATLIALWLAASLVCLIAGLVIRETGSMRLAGRDKNLQNGMRAAGIVILLAMLFSFLGYWVIGMLFVAIAFLLLVTLLRYTGS